MIFTRLLPLEQQVLDALLAGDHPVLAALREQLARVESFKRSLTGHGFYLDFQMPASMHGLHESYCVKPDFQFGDVSATLYPADQEAAFLLFVRDGKLSFLEGYVYDDEMHAMVDRVAIWYMNSERNMTELERTWSKES